MTFSFRIGGACSVLILASLLSSCGGGGGGGGAGSQGGGNHYPLTLSMTPASLTATLAQGVSEQFTINAQVAGTVSTGNTVYVVIDDTSGVVQPDKITIAQNSATAYVAWMVTSTTLPVGEDKGSINVKVCSDQSCGTVYGETNLPYDFTVESTSNDTAVAAFSGLSDWQTERGDAAQANYVPITVDPSRFTVRWLQSNMAQLLMAGIVPGASLVTDSVDRLVIIGLPPTSDPNTLAPSDGGLIAFSENDGSPVWHETLADSTGAQQENGPLSISNGTVYATQGPQIGERFGGDVSFTGLNARTGAVVFQSLMADSGGVQLIGNSGCGPGAPVAQSGMVLVSPGCITSSEAAVPVTAFDAATGQALWTSSAQGGGVSATLALDGSDLYYIVPRGTGAPSLTALSQTNGAAQWQTTLADTAVLGSQYATPALDGMGGAILVADTSSGVTVDRYDLTSGQQAWTITIRSQSPIAPGVQGLAVGNGMVYVAYGPGIVVPGNSATVAALNVADGSTAWSWSPPASDYSSIRDVIATNNLLFVSTGTAVYAVDLTTHNVVWTLSVPGGAMAISPSGILYIVTSVDFKLESGAYIQSDEALLSVNLH